MLAQNHHFSHALRRKLFNFRARLATIQTRSAFDALRAHLNKHLISEIKSLNDTFCTFIGLKSEIVQITVYPICKLIALTLNTLLTVRIYAKVLHRNLPYEIFARCTVNKYVTNPRVNARVVCGNATVTVDVPAWQVLNGAASNVFPTPVLKHIVNKHNIHVSIMELNVVLVLMRGVQDFTKTTDSFENKSVGSSGRRKSRNYGFYRMPTK